MITNVKKYVNMNYDVQKMLSVDSKVKKKDWRSNTIEICDAVSHAHFTINKGDGGYLIYFKNTEDGYNFKKPL